MQALTIRVRTTTSTLRAALALVLVVVALFAFARSASAQGNQIETLNFDQQMQVDETGNAVISIKMKLTASQFQNWQGKYGQNKSLLRRDMSKVMSMYDTYDWDVTEKQMEREITITLKARGTVVHKGNGVSEFRVPKEWRGGERHDNVFNFNYIEPVDPGIVAQFNVRLIAPAGASNFREQLSEAGEKVIQYSVPVPGKKSWMLTAGLIMTLLGAGLVGATLLIKTQPVTLAASSSSRRSKPVLAHSKPVSALDPPSMSTIPLELSSPGTPIPERKDQAKRADPGRRA